MSKGFGTNADAPRRSARARSIADASAVTMTTRGRSLRRQLLELLEHRPSIHPRHHHVEDHQVGVVAFDLIHRLEPVVGGEGLVPLALQAELEHPDDLGLVVDDEDGGLSVRDHPL